MPTFGVTSNGDNVFTKGSFKGIAKGKDVRYDLHVWLEDEAGNVIYDPFFDEYFDIIRLHGCIAVGAPSPFLPERHGRIYKKRPEWQPIIQATLKGMVKKMMRCGVVVSEYYKPPSYGCCVYNAYFEKLHHNPKAKLCVGQMGWKTKSGGEFWEFG